MGRGTGRLRTWFPWAFTAAAAVAAVVAAALAQWEPQGADRPVLHERVEGVGQFEWVPEDGVAASLAAFSPAPPGVEPAPGEPSAARAPGGDDLPPRPRTSVSDVPPDEFRSDLETNRHDPPDEFRPPGVLWSPAPGPYLRQQVFDLVRADGTVGAPDAARASLRPLPAPTGADGLERFVGRARLRALGDRPVQIPTPAPEFRAAIVAGAAPGDSLATDRAGNLFFLPGSVSGDRELVLRLEADPLAFGGSLDAAASAADVPAEARPAVPDTMNAPAQRVAEALGIPPGVPIASALRVLSRHFRSFVPGPPPAGRLGTDYELLALGRVGVCRHRAYAFVVTAQALGIPARLAISRLHAWVEALVAVSAGGPRRWVWRRIDLGGAYGFEEEGLADVPAHLPSLPDPLPWPRGASPTPSAPTPGATPIPAATAAGAGAGSPPATPGEATPSPVPGPVPPAATGDAGLPATGTGDGGAGPIAVGPAPGPGAERDAGPSPGLPPPPVGPPLEPREPRTPETPRGPSGPPETTAAPAPAPLPLAVIEHFPLDALRGQSVDIAGRLTDAAPGTRAVDVVLERSGEAPRALGTLAVGGNGEFAGVLSIPADVPPGDYALRAFAASW